MKEATTPQRADGDGALRAIAALAIIGIAFALGGRAVARMATEREDEPPPDNGNGGHHDIDPEWIEDAERERADRDADAEQPGDPSAMGEP